MKQHVAKSDMLQSRIAAPQASMQKHSTEGHKLVNSMEKSSPTCQKAVGAVIGHVIVIAALVEHAADHMHPCPTQVTGHPAFLLLIIVFPLLQLALTHIQLQHKTIIHE